MIEFKSDFELLCNRASTWGYTLIADSAYHFNIKLLNTWKITQCSLDLPDKYHPIQHLVRLQPYNCASHSFIDICGGWLSHDIHPIDWQNLYLQANQHVILERSIHYSTAYGEFGYFLSRYSENGKTYIFRSACIKHAKYILLLIAKASQEDYASFEDEFLLVTSSFDFLYPTEEIFVEAMTVYSFDLPKKGYFIFPQSWTLQPDQTPPQGGSSFSLVHLADKSRIGHFTFSAVPLKAKRTLIDLFDVYIQQLKCNQIHVQYSYKQFFRNKILNSDQPIGEANIMPAYYQGQLLELRCHLAAHQEMYVLMAMLGPSVDLHPMYWATHRRIYDIAVQTFGFV